jgi:hypothetical protein
MTLDEYIKYLQDFANRNNCGHVTVKVNFSNDPGEPWLAVFKDKNKGATVYL